MAPFCLEMNNHLVQLMRNTTDRKETDLQAQGRILATNHLHTTDRVNPTAHREHRDLSHLMIFRQHDLVLVGHRVAMLAAVVKGLT